MATGDKKAITSRLTASVAERFGVPAGQRASFARRTWFSVTLVAVLCVHAAVLVLLFHRDREVQPPQQVAETPVEVIVQPRAPEPQPATPAQPPEKPASSAPRAANDETVDHNTNDPDTHAPKSDALKSDPAKPEAAQQEQPAPPQNPAQDQAKDPAEASAAKADEPVVKPEMSAAAQRDVPDKDAEALAAAAPPEPPRRPPELAKAQPAKVLPRKPDRRPTTALQQLAGASSLPDYTFAKPMRRHAKVMGGTEDDRYLAVVYGMITQNHLLGALPDGDWLVSVTFQVDGDGNLVGAGIQRSSGFPQIDFAALQAVESAAPFPPPPSGAITGLIARLHSAGGRAAALGNGDR